MELKLVTPVMVKRKNLKEAAVFKQWGTGRRPERKANSPIGRRKMKGEG